MRGANNAKFTVPSTCWKINTMICSKDGQVYKIKLQAGRDREGYLDDCLLDLTYISYFHHQAFIAIKYEIQAVS